MGTSYRDWKSSTECRFRPSQSPWNYGFQPVEDDKDTLPPEEYMESVMTHDVGAYARRDNPKGAAFHTSRCLWRCQLSVCFCVSPAQRHRSASVAPL